VNESTYPRYRQPRTRWLPPVPEHWNEQRAKTLFREVDERSQTGQEELLSVSHLTGITPRSQKNVTMFKAESYIGSKLCRPDDIVINTLWAWMAALGVSKHAGIVSPAYGVYRPLKPDGFNPVYLDYLLRIRSYVAEYTCRSTGIRASRLRLYPEKFLDIALIQPPLAEQTQIANYLRTQDTKIARFIRIKRELIERLKEQKLRLIDHAVTGGLDTTVQRKPSGVDWLGEVPGHWDVLRLKYIADVVLGKMLTTQSKGGDTLKPYLRSKNVQWLKPDVSDVQKMWMTDAEIHSLRIRKNDILVSEGGEVGRACIWSEELPECYIQNSVHRVSAKAAILPEFLLHQFHVYGKFGRFNAIVNRVSIAHLTREKLVTVPFIVPPLEEQHTLLAHIKTQTAPIDRAITQSEQEITLIREYRERLIADAVTGQIDLRGWQPSADDLTFEDDSLAALADDDAPDAPEDARDDDD